MAFFPSDPQDHAKTMAELRAWEYEQKVRKKAAKRDTRRYWITTGIAAVALIKAFFPELREAVEAVWKLLTQ